MSASQTTASDGVPTLVDAPVGPDGNNRLVGTSGDDRIFGGNGNDVLLGGAGNDLLHGEAGRDRVFGEEGNDRLLGGTEDDVLSGGPGADRMEGQRGNDSYVVDDLGDVVFEGVDQGRDKVTALVSFTLPAEVEDLQLAGNANIDGVGNELRNVLSGNIGSKLIANRLEGGAGDDDLYGRDGDDILLGGDGNDRHFAGTGADRMAGGLGDDRYYLQGGDDLVNENPGEGTDRIYTRDSHALQAEIEQLFLQGFGNSTGVGNAADNYLRGNFGNNRLDGGDGNDEMAGLDGRDRLIGGLGSDDMRGNADADVFVFRSIAEAPAGAGQDLIRDFEVGVDRLNLDLIDADVAAAGNQQFTYIGGQAFSNTAGELRYDSNILRGDVNGDGIEDMQIAFLNGAALTVDDFVL